MLLTLQIKALLYVDVTYQVKCMEKQETSHLSS